MFLWSFEVSVTSVDVPVTLRDVTAEIEAATLRYAYLHRPSVGRIIVTGNDRLDLLHRLSTNDLLSRKVGDVVGTVFTTDKGRIIDYSQVAIQQSSLLLLVSAEHEKQLSSWIDKYTIMDDVHVQSVTDSTAMFTVIGPESTQFVHSAMGVVPSQNSHVEVTMEFGKVVVLARTEHQTEIIDIVVDAANAAKLEQLLRLTAGETGRTMSHDAYEVFRISRGIVEADSELNESYNPFDVGLLDAVSFTKGCYIGQEVIARIDTYQKAHRCLFGIISDSERGWAPPSAKVIAHGAEAGVVTSSSRGSVGGKRVMLAVLKKDLVHADDYISIAYDNVSLDATIGSLPLRFA